MVKGSAKDSTKSASCNSLTSAKRSIRNKLTKRDLRRATIIWKRGTSEGRHITLNEVTKIINDGKPLIKQVHRSTLSRHLEETPIRHNSSNENIPPRLKRKDLSSWLRIRRGMAQWRLKYGPSFIYSLDESIFGLHRKHSEGEAIWHPIGAVVDHPRKTVEEKESEVRVFSLVGQDFNLPLKVFDQGFTQSSKTYAALMRDEVLPQLKAHDKSAILIQDNLSLYWTPECKHLYRSYSTFKFKRLATYSPDF